MISRRRFIAASLLAAPALALAALGEYDLVTGAYTGSLTVERMDIPIRELPSAFHGYKIGFLTDLHLGLWIPDRWITDSLDALAGEKVDLALLGGDYILMVDNPIWQRLGVVRNWEFTGLKTRIAIEAIYTRVTELLSPYSFPDGMLAVPGNHDHWNDYTVFERVFRQSPAAGLLVNSATTIERRGDTIEIFGTDDFLTGIPALPLARQAGERRVPRIVLSHNPDYVSLLLREGRNDFDLALCGHTHGGQIRIPGVGPIVSQVSDTRFVSGLVNANGAAVYTSRGIGVVGLPFRFCCPPEITVLRLVLA